MATIFGYEVQQDRYTSHGRTLHEGFRDGDRYGVHQSRHFITGEIHTSVSVWDDNGDFVKSFWIMDEHKSFSRGTRMALRLVNWLEADPEHINRYQGPRFWMDWTTEV